MCSGFPDHAHHQGTDGSNVDTQQKRRASCPPFFWEYSLPGVSLLPGVSWLPGVSSPLGVSWLFESLPAVTECPGREAPPGPRRNVRLLLLRLFGLLRLFRLLRFLSHSILSRFNGLKRDTRDARRRASLAKSSSLIPADSQPPASCCHACVTALSTDVMRSAAFFPTPTSPLAATARQRYGEFRKAPAPPFINSKPRRRFHGGVESPLSGRAASCSRTTEERPWAGLA